MTDTMSTHHSEPESAPARSASTRNGSSIACSICQAVYAPAQVYEYLLQAPRVALESAFMSMCHFCFRCRRPACPSCWDYVHGVCGSCALEANLPFRLPSTPLQGVLFPPVRQAQLKHKRAVQTRLICVRPGKFQNGTSIDSAETLLINTVATEDIPHQKKMSGATLDTKPSEQSSSKEIPLPATRSIAQSAQVNIDEIVTRPETYKNVDIDKITTKPESRNNAISIDEIATRPEPFRTFSETATKPEPRNGITINKFVTRAGRRRSISRQIERAIVSILLALLLFVVVLIVLAEISQGANTITLQITHINIRVEIAYILQLIRQVFS